jgi:hypothetical protein
MRASSSVRHASSSRTSTPQDSDGCIVQMQ